MRNLAAESAYRAAWAAYLLSSDDAERLIWEQVMDSQQVLIASNPKDERWVAFTATLPGFVEFWKRGGPVRRGKFG